MTEDVGGEVVLVALFPRRSTFTSSCACIVEAFAKSVIISGWRRLGTDMMESDG
jgi:hypothetical protein